MKALALAVSGMAFLALVGCGKNSYDYEGKYDVTIGEDCVEDENPDESEGYWLQIVKQSKNGQDQYLLKYPLLVPQGVPLTSPQPASASEDGELTFTYSKSEPGSRLSPAYTQEFVIKLKPNKNKANHIWITKQDMITVVNGKVSEADLFGKIRKQGMIGTTGMCLKKRTEKS